MSAQGKNESIFIIQSKIDDQQFTVDKKVIGSSALLKNICDITKITEPISLNCSGHSLQVFITLINHYQTIGNDHDIEFEKSLYDSATLKNKQNLIQLIQDLCVLDSDFFLDSIADYILDIIGFEEKWNWMHIQKYFGFEDDFSNRQRKLMENEENLEYFFSISTETFKFPCPNKSLYSLKTDFSTPMNVLIARIIQRSNEKVSYLLSLINKTIKNEVDRHPLKLTEFNASLQTWTLVLFFSKSRKGFTFLLNCRESYRSHFGMRDIQYNEEYINIIKRRKIIASDVSIHFLHILKADEPFIDSNSLIFVHSKKPTEITLQESYKTMYYFNVESYQNSSILFRFNSLDDSGINFEEIYKHLIAKDLSKRIQLQMANDIFGFFHPFASLWFHKKPNASKFESLEVRYYRDICAEFKNFVTTYMEDDGVIKSSKVILGIPLDEVDAPKIYDSYVYKVSDVKKYLNCIVTK